MDNRAIVKQFISERWSDQKIAEVFAFNQDGKMRFSCYCCCLLGVDGADVLHDDYCDIPHYLETKHGYCEDQESIGLAIPKMESAELAYGRLGAQLERNRILGEILTEIMAEREALRELSPADVAAIQEVTHG